MKNPMAERYSPRRLFRGPVIILAVVSGLYGLAAVQLRTGWEGWLQLGLYLSVIAVVLLGIPLAINWAVQRRFPGLYSVSKEGLLLVRQYAWGERAVKAMWSEVWKIDLTPRPGWVRVELLRDEDRRNIAENWRSEKVAREDHLMTIEIADSLWRQVREWVPTSVVDGGKR